MKTLFVLLPSLLLCSTVLSATATDKFSRPDLLAEPAELAKPEIANKFVILDARPRKDFAITRSGGTVGRS